MREPRPAVSYVVTDEAHLITETQWTEIAAVIDTMRSEYHRFGNVLWFGSTADGSIPLASPSSRD